MENEVISPETLVEAVRYFSDADTCLSYLIPIPWPQGVTCPHCGGAENSFIYPPDLAMQGL